MGISHSWMAIPRGLRQEVIISREYANRPHVKEGPPLDEGVVGFDWALFVTRETAMTRF